MTLESFPTQPSAWSLLLDRLEHRLRLLETAARSNPQHVDAGPPPGPSDVPVEPPTPEERVRLLALMANHEQAIGRLEQRRRTLRQAQHYRMGAA